MGRIFEYAIGGSPMNAYISNSILIRTFTSLVSTYRTSVTAKVLKTVGQWYSTSQIHGFFYRFMRKEPVFQHTHTYRLLVWLCRPLDKAVGAFSGILSRWSQSSISAGIAKGFSAELRSSTAGLLSHFLLAFVGGYSLVISIRGMWNTRKLIILFIAAAAAFCAFLYEKHGKRWIMESNVYKLMKYIIE